jgi:hypothetical protein
MNNLDELISWLKTTWNSKLLNLGDNAFSIKSFILLVLSLFLLFYISSKIRKFLVNKIITRYYADIGISHWHYEVFAKFKKSNVEIPFPQQDIHLKSGFEKVADSTEN